MLPSDALIPINCHSYAICPCTLSTLALAYLIYLHLTPLTPTGQMEGPQQIARRSDMDMNGHINNAVYLTWVIESIPQEIYDTCMLFEASIEWEEDMRIREGGN